MEFHFIEMTKLIRDWQANKLDPWNDVLARWLLMLGMVDRRNGKVYEDIFKELEGIAMKDDTLHEAFKSWEVLSGTKEQMIAYEGRMKRIFDEEAAVREAELREIDARREGVEEGIQEGERRGEQKGERKAKEATARILLTEGFEIPVVANLVQLDEERIKEIEKERSEGNG